MATKRPALPGTPTLRITIRMRLDALDLCDSVWLETEELHSRSWSLAASAGPMWASETPPEVRAALDTIAVWMRPIQLALG